MKRKELTRRGRKNYKWSSSEDKNWRSGSVRWAAEEWQSTKEGGGDMSPEERKEPEEYGLWNTDVSGQGTQTCQAREEGNGRWLGRAVS